VRKEIGRKKNRKQINTRSCHHIIQIPKIMKVVLS
jgi:hypothetical protein